MGRNTTMSNLRFLLARSLASGIVRGGERPEFVDTSRPENKPAGTKMAWTKKEKKADGQQPPTEASQQGDQPRNSEDLQRGYEELFQ
jgi:hypothetical protein